MQNDAGNVITNEIAMEEIARIYFKNNFTTKGIGNMEHILSRVEKYITDNMNQLLITKYSDEDVFVTLK